MSEATPLRMLELPARPHLYWLKNRAKDRLVELRAKDPAAKLAAAQRDIAMAYGFASWRKLADHIGSLEMVRFKQSLRDGDVPAVRQILEQSSYIQKRINNPIGDFGGRPIHLATNNPAMMDVLQEFGADINLRSDWKNGPFSVLDSASEEAVRQYLQRGAKLTVHAAARLGWIDELRRMLAADPSLVDEKGGDGQRPLHFAKTPEIVNLLLDHGADIDARCVDHQSTAAQYALAERPDVAAHLIARGATADIFIAARLGDRKLADRLIRENPASLAARINAPGYPSVPPFGIYCWSLGWRFSPHEVALKYEHRHLFEHLFAVSPTTVKLLVACTTNNQAVARKLVSDDPKLISRLLPDDHAVMAFVLGQNPRPEAVRLMLSFGFDPMARGLEGGTLLHIACWHGFDEIVSLLLTQYRDKIDLEARDPNHHGTSMNWAMHGSTNSWEKHGDYAKIVENLIAAGAKLPETIGDPTPAVREVLLRHDVSAGKA